MEICFDLQVQRNMNNKRKSDSKKEKGIQRNSYRNYSSSSILEAVRLVRECHMFVYKASKGTGISWSSLKGFLLENETEQVNPIVLNKMGKPFASIAEDGHKLLKCHIYAGNGV